jgi:hypothetical protein
MADELTEDIKTQLALALAQGISVIRWARTNNVPKTTAYRWAQEPQLRKEVEACRRRILDRAVGKLTKSSTFAAERIRRLAETAESESVQLKASKSILSDMAALSKFSGLEGRMLEVEEQLSEYRAGLENRQG